MLAYAAQALAKVTGSDFVGGTVCTRRGTLVRPCLELAFVCCGVLCVVLLLRAALPSCPPSGVCVLACCRVEPSPFFTHALVCSFVVSVISSLIACCGFCVCACACRANARSTRRR